MYVFYVYYTYVVILLLCVLLFVVLKFNPTGFLFSKSKISLFI